MHAIIHAIEPMCHRVGIVHGRRRSLAAKWRQTSEALWTDIHQALRGKDEHMDPRFVVTSKLLFDQGWDDSGAGTHEYTAAELDDIVDFSWPWAGLPRAVLARLQALWPRRHRLPAPAAPSIVQPQMHSR